MCVHAMCLGGLRCECFEITSINLPFPGVLLSVIPLHMSCRLFPLSASVANAHAFLSFSVINSSHAHPHPYLVYGARLTKRN